MFLEKILWFEKGQARTEGMKHETHTQGLCVTDAQNSWGSCDRFLRPISLSVVPRNSPQRVQLCIYCATTGGGVQ